MQNEFRMDALIPPEMARRAEEIGIKKVEMPNLSIFVLAVLAGAFIALGAIFATTVATGTAAALSFGVSKLLTGFVFCLGLVLVVIAGAELFTGNNLIVMAWASGKVSSQSLLRNWAIVYVGNFMGAVGTALLMFLTRQYTFAGGDVGVTALAIANSKVNLGFTQAIVLGILCNALVCIAVWLTFSARTTLDKIAAIIFPITAFVAAGFEHSIANMYFVPIALFIKTFDTTYTTSQGMELSNLTWSKFLGANLLPVTIGNIIGGALLVAAVYWFVYLRDNTA
ncbi:MAG: formate/nitrite family transporter [Anaerolineae bacterium]|nr:formate/nitrite family transporter [Anaerolineae bacterium]